MTDFEEVLRRLDDGFHLEMIAQPLEVSGRDEPFESVRENARKMHHDFAFIGRRRSDGATFWVDSVLDVKEGVSREVRPDDLVSASMPLSSAIRFMAGRAFALVLTGDRVKTIVTPSDLNLLPVRVMLFTIMAHAEMRLGDAIVRARPSDTWMDLLSQGQQLRVRELQAQKAKHEADTRLIDCTSLGQKCAVVEKSPELWAAVGCSDGKQFKLERRLFQQLRDKLFHHQQLVGGEEPPGTPDDEPEDALRDALAHHGRFVAAAEGVGALADVVDLLRRWIGTLSGATWSGRP